MTPEEIAAQEAAAKEAADKAKADEDAKKATDEAARAAAEEEARKAKEAEDAKKAEDEAKRIAEGGTPPGEEPTGAEKRIRELVAKQREAERQAEYYRGLAEGRGKPPDAAPTPAPKIEDFLPTQEECAAIGLTPEAFEKAGRSYDDLIMAKSIYAAKKMGIVLERQNAEAKQKEEIQRSQETFMDRLSKAAESDPEILDVARNYHIPTSPYFVPISNPMADVIRESEVGPKLIRFLASNKAESARIAKLPPMAAARELGRIEAKILATPAPPPPQKISQAPAPIAPLTPTGVTEIDLDKIPIDDFMKKRNRETGYIREAK